MQVAAPTMDTVTSRDGATIAYWRSGEGQPLVLVHGSISDRTTWALVLPKLQERFTVYAMHRRGREGSAATTSLTIDDEFADVAAVVDAVGEPVHLLGHSFGAVCSLGATRLTSNIRSLILYEPPVLGASRAGLKSHIRDLVRDGRADEALTAFLTQAIRMSQGDVEKMKESPFWAHLVGLVPSLVGELEASRDYHFDAAQFAGLGIRVLLLVGGETEQHGRSVNQALADVLPSSELRELPSERHLAQFSSPNLFTSEVLRFLESVEA